MPRPFPLPLRIGTDISSVPRFYNKLIHSDHKIRLAYIKKILTPEEWLAHEQKYIIPLDKWKDNVFGADGWTPKWKYGDTKHVTVQSEQNDARVQNNQISATFDFGNIARLLAGRYAVPGVPACILLITVGWMTSLTIQPISQIRCERSNYEGVSGAKVYALGYTSC
jgi:hypothetical protein